MEIDVKKETEKARGEVKSCVAQINEVVEQVDILNQRKQELLKELFKKQGELEYLNRVNGEKKPE